MFGFGSCGSWSILVRFASVFGTFCINIFFLFFFRRRKSKYRLLPARGLLLPASGFMSSGFQRAERAELGKPKLPEIVSACNLLWRNPYQLFQSVYWGRVRRFRFLRFGFAHGSSGSRFLRFIGYLIFYGSVPRFRFGSRTLLPIAFCLLMVGFTLPNLHSALLSPPAALNSFLFSRTMGSSNVATPLWQHSSNVAIPPWDDRLQRQWTKHMRLCIYIYIILYYYTLYNRLYYILYII